MNKAQSNFLTVWTWQHEKIEQDFFEVPRFLSMATLSALFCDICDNFSLAHSLCARLCACECMCVCVPELVWVGVSVYIPTVPLHALNLVPFLISCFLLAVSVCLQTHWRVSFSFLCWPVHWCLLGLISVCVDLIFITLQILPKSEIISGLIPAPACQTQICPFLEY